MTSQDLRVCTLVTDSEGNSGSQGPGRPFPVVRVATSVYPGGSAHFLDHPQAPCACALHAPCDPAHYRPQLPGAQLAEPDSCASALRARRRLPEAPGR